MLLPCEALLLVATGVILPELVFVLNPSGGIYINWFGLVDVLMFPHEEQEGLANIQFVGEDDDKLFERLTEERLTPLLGELETKGMKGWLSPPLVFMQPREFEILFSPKDGNWKLNIHTTITYFKIDVC